MALTVISANSGSEIGVSCRKNRLGPENTLIERLLENVYTEVPEGYRITIFREPQLQSGFPDLVFVILDETVTEKWNIKRMDLKSEDIQLMHYLIQVKQCMPCELQQVFPKRLKLKKSLARLEAAEMIECVGEHWVPMPLSEMFAATQIIAIEAKMTQWHIAIEQAFLNTWFASASYVLVPQIPKREYLLKKADAAGISICTQEIELSDILTEKISQPRSYASWLFNEWSWRASLWQ